MSFMNDPPTPSEEGLRVTEELNPLNVTKPVIAVDIDEVLTDLVPALVSFHNMEYGMNITTHTYISYYTSA